MHTPSSYTPLPPLTPGWSAGSLKIAGGCVTLLSWEPGGWKYWCALGVNTKCLVMLVGMNSAGSVTSEE